MVAAALWFVATYGSEIPWADDWDFHVPQVSGERPAGRVWLLERFGEYPTPLSKFLLYAFSRWFGFHGELYTHVFILAALSAALILTAGRIRGRPSFADAFFPLALQHFGSDNFIWASQLVNFLPTVLVCTVLMMIVCWGVALPPVAAIGAGIVLLALALSGPAGLVYVPGVSLWLALVAADRWFTSVDREEPHGRARALGHGVLASRTSAILLLGFILVANQFMGYSLLESQEPLPGQYRKPAELEDTLKTSVQLMSMSFGHVNTQYWKFLGLGMFGLVGVALIVLATEWFSRPSEHARVLGLLVIIASALLLVIGTGRARGAFPDPKGLQNHYVPHVVTIPIAVYLTFAAFGPIAVRRAVQYGLMLVMLLVLPQCIEQGLHMANRIRTGSTTFTNDLLAGKPPAILAERHSRFFFALEPHSYSEWEYNLANHIRGLHRAGKGVFQYVKDPAYREVKIPIDPIDVGDATWHNGVLRTASTNGFITFALPEPTFVYGIRVKYSYRDSAEPNGGVGRVSFRAAWKNRDQPFGETERTERIDLDPDPQLWGPTWLGEGTLTVWINDTIDRIRLYPLDRPGVFHLLDLSMLLPMADYQMGGRISTTDPAAASYFGDGWHDPDGNARATERRAVIAFKLAQLERPNPKLEKPKRLNLRLRILPFGQQRLVVRVNGHDIADIELGGNASETVEVEIPAEVLTERNTITLVVPRGRSPRSIDNSDDDRVLGVAVEWWELLPLD